MSGDELNPATVVARRSDVLFAEVDGEMVLLAPGARRYFGLNEVGSVVWEQLDRPTALDRVHREIVDRYEVGEDEAWADLMELVKELEKHGLVERVAP
ncbi:MAG: PqqD family protein [Acidobacteria bacterium]|jgi:hypothetical protein|nr:PqqD family protein [Acidobacteriota bacterium]